MKFSILKLNISPQHFLRKCGYIEIQNPHKKGEISHARSLDPGRFYPRFHIYIEENPGQTAVNLHLDAKKPSYEGTPAHGGEYEGKLVEQETERIKKISENYILKFEKRKLGFESKKSFWQKIKDYFK